MIEILGFYILFVNRNGCIIEVNVVVVGSSCGKIDVFIFNVFMLNDDGIYDFF